MKVSICGFNFELPNKLLDKDKDVYASLEADHDIASVETERKTLMAALRRNTSELEKYTRLADRAFKKLEEALDKNESVDLAEKNYDGALDRRIEAERTQDIQALTQNEQLSELNRKSNLFYLSYLHYLATTHAGCDQSLSDWNYKATLEDYQVSYSVIEKKYLLLRSPKANKLLTDTTANTLRKSA